MHATRTEPLDDYALATCMHCGAVVWLYSTPSGTMVALDDAPGPYVIAGTKAYRSTGNGGYRGHWDHCKMIATARPCTGVDRDEFLWG